MALTWLRQQVEKAGEPTGGTLEPETEEALRKALESLNGPRKDLAARAVEWVATGREQDLFEDVASRRSSRVLRLKLATQDLRFSGSRLTDFFEEHRTVSGAVAFRIGVLCAACQLRDSAHSIPWVSEVPSWLECLIWESTTILPSAYVDDSQVTAYLPASTLVSALQHAGEESSLLVRILSPPDQDVMSQVVTAMRRTRGMAEQLSAQASVVDEALEEMNARQVVQLVASLRTTRVDPRPWIERLTRLACSGRKTVMSEVSGLMKGHWPKALGTLRQLLVEGAATERRHAARLLARHGDDRQLLVERLQQERAKAVRDEIETALGPVSTDETTPAGRQPLTVPQRSALPPPEPPREAQNEAVGRLLTRYFETARSNWQTRQQQLAAAATVDPEPQPVSDAEVAQVCATLSAPEPWLERPGALVPKRLKVHVWGDEEVAAVIDACDEGDLSLIERCRLVHHLGLLDQLCSVPGQVLSQLAGVFDAARRPDGEPIDLRDLAEALGWCGVAKDLVARALLEDVWGPGTVRQWRAEQVWPYFTEHPELLREALGFVQGGHFTKRFHFELTALRRNAYGVLGCFPYPPAEYTQDLWDAALGSNRADRERAQRCLQNEPDVVERLVRALGDGKQDVRAEAASWLARRGARETASELRRAVKKEKRDVPKAAMLAALEAFGEPIDSFLDRDALRVEAEKGLKKSLPQGLEWIGTLDLPEVHWRDSGELVNPRIVRWWVTKSVRLKKPEPDPLLLRYCAMLRPAEAQALADYLLEGWITEDTRLPTEVPPEADQELRLWAGYFGGQQGNVKVYERLVEQYLQEPHGSAIAAKGVLAVVAAAGGPDVVSVIERYLKRWYGWRAAQCKALLHVLAWCNEPLATQLLLSVAGRFRTAGIRKEAERLVQELAERQGWTMDELADRTAPDAGFDRDGRQQLEYLTEQPADPKAESKPEVSRTIELRLDDALAVHVIVDGGRELKNLPSARTEEDEASVAAAKKRLSQIKRSLKQIVAQQSTRLYEAMCSERRWPLDEWRRYLLEHPVLGRLVRRLVWVAIDGEQSVAFRPLEDGSLTDVEDNEVELAEGALVRVGHVMLLEPDQVEAWSEHLADYEVEPLFEQLAAERFQLPPERARNTELKEFEGHMVRAFRLRSRAKKLGYVRGSSEDGGWFYTYHKHFPSLGIDVVLEFTGNRMPEEDGNAALRTMRFERLRSEQMAGQLGAKLTLGEVPEVLLAESRHHLSTLAADGTGYDPDWEKKAYG